MLRASHQRCVGSCIFFVGRTDFDFFVRFENSACCIDARRHVLAPVNYVCLLALSHSDRHILALGLCRAGGALLWCARGTSIHYMRSVCLLALSHSDRHVAALCGLIMLCCAVLCCAVLCCAVHAVLQYSRCSMTTC